MSSEPSAVHSTRLSREGATRLLNGLGAAAVAERLLVRAERLASQSGSSEQLAGIRISFCRATQPVDACSKPHFEYYRIGSVRDFLIRDEVLAELMEALIAGAA